MKTTIMIAALLLAGCDSIQPHSLDQLYSQAQSYPQTRPGTNCQFRLDAAARATELARILLPGCEGDPDHKRKECKALVAALKANKANRIYEDAAACLIAGQYGDLTAEVARYRINVANRVSERIDALAKRLY